MGSNVYIYYFASDSGFGASRKQIKPLKLTCPCFNKRREKQILNDILRWYSTFKRLTKECGISVRLKTVQKYTLCKLSSFPFSHPVLYLHLPILRIISLSITYKQIIFQYFAQNNIINGSPYHAAQKQDVATYYDDIPVPRTCSFQRINESKKGYAPRSVHEHCKLSIAFCINLIGCTIIIPRHWFLSTTFCYTVLLKYSLLKIFTFLGLPNEKLKKPKYQLSIFWVCGKQILCVVRNEWSFFLPAYIMYIQIKAVYIVYIFL